MTVTVVVPTFNERGNVEELVDRLTQALSGREAEVLFVDDSTDDTPQVISRVAARNDVMPIRLIHRAPTGRTGGLAGAVTAGLAVAGEHVVVMDADLQHPPELVPLLIDGLDDADVVVASRYVGHGDAAGLTSAWRKTVSSTSTLVAQACFPRRVGRTCSDPMTGFFALRRSSVDLGRLRPRGFKILLEILARHDLRVVDLPFAFGERFAGESKASWRNGMWFLYQLASLRMGRMSRFAVVGGLGTVVNLVVMWTLMSAQIHYLVAAVVAAEISVLHNFLMQERFVFRDLRRDSSAGRWRRCLLFFGWNNADTLARLPLLSALVSVFGMNPLAGQALTLAVAFMLRFLFVSHVVYRPRRGIGPSHHRGLGSIYGGPKGEEVEDQRERAS